MRSGYAGACVSPRIGSAAMARATQPLGLGLPGRAVGTSEARAAAPGVVADAGLRLDGASRSRRARRRRCRRRAVAARARWRTSARPTTATARAHASGKSYVDTCAASAGAIEHVARRRRPPAPTRREVEAVLEWAAGANVAVIPYGGGTSVVGGVEPRVPGASTAPSRSTSARWTGCWRSTPVSRAARIQAGALGPAPGGAARRRTALTLRFYPQSFELSTLGGWIATRAGGHFATGATHIDDLVESVRAITPSGRVGVAAAAGLGRRAVARPDAARLGGDPRRHHRGVGARAAAARAPRRARRCASPSFVAGAEAVRAIVAGRACGPPTAGCIDAARGRA